MLSKNLLKWWLLVTLTISGIVIANYFDMIAFVWENDFTKLSFVIASIFILTTAVIGFKMVSVRKGRRNKATYEKEWFAAETLLSFGLLGTVIGLLYVFTSAFEDLDIGDVQAAQEVITIMASGMGSAFLTTAVGIVFSTLLKSQLVLAEDVA